MARLMVATVMVFQMATSVVLADEEPATEVESEEIAQTPPLNPGVEALLDCISWAESRDTPNAYNPSSGAAGQYQFMLSTWLETPQGRAGYSRYNPVAAREAARWMVNRGLKYRWSVVRMGLC